MKTVKSYKGPGAATRNAMFMNAIGILCAVAIIVLFFNTGLGKIINHDVFTIQMKKQPLPIWSKPILVYILPILELGTVFLLCTARTRLVGFALATTLLISYTIYAYLAYIEFYGYVICACGKIFQNMGWRDHFYVNLIFTVLTMVGTCLTFKRSRRHSFK